MLLHLSIKDIVLIEQCEIALPETGLCVMTGETGAGKSILLDALALALGMRGEKGLVRHGKPQGSVSAEFDIHANKAAKKLLTEMELEEADQLIIRRSISADGKTRCLVNDQPISVAGLKKLGETLVEIHGQHDQRGLLDPATHLSSLDQFARLEKQAREVAVAHATWKDAIDKHQAALAAIAETRAQEEYLRHMRQELQQLAPQPGEEQTLADQRAMMMQGEKLAQTLQDVMQELQGSGQNAKPVEASLRTAQRILSRSALNTKGRFGEVADQLEKALVEVQESINAIEALARDSQYDPEKLEQTEERLFALRAASRKYNMPVDELAALLTGIEEKLQGLDSEEGHIAALEKAVGQAKELFRVQAEKLSEARAKAARTLEKSLVKELTPLKMGEAKFAVSQERLEETQWNAAGMDRVRFEVATNPGSPIAPLHKIASGGELSRFMLALKVVMSGVRSASTLIFDEIDTGTGGAVADAIGDRLGALGEEVQVIVVTHLPQVAAKGSYHLKISKHAKAGVTLTNVEPLKGEARKEELARMLAGAQITAEARKAAGKLLEA